MMDTWRVVGCTCGFAPLYAASERKRFGVTQVRFSLGDENADISYLHLLEIKDNFS